MVQPGRKPVADRARLAGQKPQARVDALGRRMERGRQHHVTPVNGGLGDAVARQVDGAAVSCPPDLGRAVLRVDRADPCLKPGRADRDALAEADLTGDDRTGHHHADALECEHPIDG
ncbi:MAG TPA: hypothetical protein VHY34_06295 [Caulobacteraceae bacterium]|nr:hypothetical protein [Caulobacteraceae bacterium]